MKENQKTEKRIITAQQGRFLRLIEKRIRKFVRYNKLFKKGQKILVLDSLDLYFVKSITKEIPLKVYTARKGRRFDFVIKQWTADDEINLFLKSLFHAKKPEKQNFIKLLSVITDEEAEEFAKLKEIKFKPNKKEGFVQQFVNAVNERYPDTKYKLIKSIETLKDL